MKKYLKCLKGFPIGNCVLLLSYILVYALDGNPRYAQEIAQLTEFRYFLGQVVFSGISFVVIALTLRLITEFAKMGKNVKWGDLIKFLAAMTGIIVVATVASALIDRKGSLNDYVGEVFIGVSIIIMISYAIGYVVYTAIQNYKINRALKEKQSK